MSTNDGQDSPGSDSPGQENLASAFTPEEFAELERLKDAVQLAQIIEMYYTAWLADNNLEDNEIRSIAYMSGYAHAARASRHAIRKCIDDGELTVNPEYAKKWNAGKQV